MCRSERGKIDILVSAVPGRCVCVYLSHHNHAPSLRPAPPAVSSLATSPPRSSSSVDGSRLLFFRLARFRSATRLAGEDGEPPLMPARNDSQTAIISCVRLMRSALPRSAASGSKRDAACFRRRHSIAPPPHSSRSTSTVRVVRPVPCALAVGESGGGLAVGESGGGRGVGAACRSDGGDGVGGGGNGHGGGGDGDGGTGGGGGGGTGGGGGDGRGQSGAVQPRHRSLSQVKGLHHVSHGGGRSSQLAHPAHPSTSRSGLPQGMLAHHSAHGSLANFASALQKWHSSHLASRQWSSANASSHQSWQRAARAAASAEAARASALQKEHCLHLHATQWSTS